MGAADVVPGVSGGTLAFILGIYERFLNALTSFNFNALGLLRRGHWRRFWHHIDGTFLTCLFGGILLSIASLAGAISYMLEHHPVPLWALFNGLILGALPYLLKPITFNSFRLVLLVVGVAIGASISFLTPMQSSPEPWLFFIAGFIAICAMILPGISGSFLLLLMGMYAPVVAAVSDFQVGLLLLFACGCVVGLFVFSRVLTALLQHFHDSMLALLCGIVIGALLRIWPWQYESTLISPGRYAELFGDADIGFALLGVATGFAIIRGLMHLEQVLGAQAVHPKTAAPVETSNDTSTETGARTSTKTNAEPPSE